MRQDDVYPTLVTIHFPCFSPTCPTDCVLLWRTPTLFQGHATRRDSFPQGHPKNFSNPVPQTPETRHSRVGRLDALLRGRSTRCGFVHQRIASQIRTDHFSVHAVRGGLQKHTRSCGCSQFGATGVPRTRPVCRIAFKMPPVNRTGTCSLISIPPRPIYFDFERIF